MKYFSAICFLLVSLLSFNNAYCSINKWVDDSGQVHYSDQPPPEDTESTSLDSTVAAASGVAASDVNAPKSLAEREAELKKSKKAKTEAEQKASKQQTEADAKQKYCLDLRSSLKGLEESPRIATYDANGEPSFLNDAERQQRIQETFEGIEANCK